jgi:cell division septum initiation protein DivIVA
MDLLHLVDRLEEQIGEARRLPIGTGSVVDRRRLLDLVDQLRAAVPQQVREASGILEKRDEVLAKADEEAAVRLARADEEVSRRIQDSEIVRAAETRAQEIISEARREGERLIQDARMEAQRKGEEGARLASEQMDEADRYAMEMLRKLEQQLGAFANSVRTGIESLDRASEPERPVSAQPPAPPTMAGEPPPLPYEEASRLR